MKAAEIIDRPSFSLMKQWDIINFYHLQMPRWLFVHPKYKTLSTEAKVAYTFLLNRFQLSRLNNWVNQSGEVFIIFTRENLADEIQISYKKAIECFKELVSVGLIWERRLGRGYANQIYLAVVEHSQETTNTHTAAPFGNEGSIPAKMEYQKDKNILKEDSKAILDVSKEHIKTCENDSLKTAKTAYLNIPNQHTSYIDNSYNNFSNIDLVSQSICDSDLSTQTYEEKQLSEILSQSELQCLPQEVQAVFENAITRLFYSNILKVGNSVLPQNKVRRHLQNINGFAVEDAYKKLRANTENKIKNTTAYLMVIIFNSITEWESDLLADPYLNTMRVPRK